VVNFWSISLFDQSVTFLYLILASVGAVQVHAVLEHPASGVAALPTLRTWRPSPAASPALATAASGPVAAPSPVHRWVPKPRPRAKGTTAADSHPDGRAGRGLKS